MSFAVMALLGLVKVTDAHTHHEVRHNKMAHHEQVVHHSSHGVEKPKSKVCITFQKTIQPVKSRPTAVPSKKTYAEDRQSAKVQSIPEAYTNKYEGKYGNYGRIRDLSDLESCYGDRDCEKNEKCIDVVDDDSDDDDDRKCMTQEEQDFYARNQTNASAPFPPYVATKLWDDQESCIDDDDCSDDEVCQKGDAAMGKCVSKY